MTPPVEPTKTGRFLNHPGRSRLTEDVAFWLAMLLALVYVLGVETFPTVCYGAGVCERAPGDHPFPWMLLAVMALLVAPKTIGRATAGKVWEALANRFGSKP